MVGENTELNFRLTADTEQFKTRLSDAAKIGRGFGQEIRGAFTDAVFRGKELSDVFRDLALNTSDSSLRRGTSRPDAGLPRSRPRRMLMVGENTELNFRLTADTEQFKTRLSDAAKIGRGFGQEIRGAFTDAVFRGKELSDVFRDLALNLSQVAARQAFQPLNRFFDGIFQNAFSGITGFAKGGVVGSAPVTPFANGGVLSAPMAFPMGRGQLGLAGEAGPEAILPLSRGADGRLGVRADGGGGGVNITVNVTTSDADSFRRSEGQIAAMLNRAVARGKRNL